MAQLKDNMTHFITKKEIDEATSRLAQELDIDYHGKEVILIAPLKGSFMFMADLSRKMNLKGVVMDFVYLKSMKSAETVEIKKDIEINITDKHVIVVEEIIDAGRTLSFLLKRLSSSRPASLRVLTLLDKPARREIPFKPDYVGLTIDDRYVVGYGMDSEEKGRNYSDIYSFKM
ncbi:MAG: hypoxanthine phosphoribosyltransferase [Bdellovibrionales bacterium]|nr:hypoxanthine phosphoribosyltransferase [Bdellovibrionales bacterium]NQZ19231.1 hypoxanthine phosphoribosyltransferase [Bdellovibrionales bacterium]